MLKVWTNMWTTVRMSTVDEIFESSRHMGEFLSLKTS